MSKPAHGPRQLLILDDDDLVGMLVATVARLDGMTVRLTERAVDFFAALAEAPPTHIVLDLTMPDQTGEDTLLQLAQHGCQARVILSSGAEPQRLVDAAELARDLGLTLVGALPKPFAPAALRALLAQA